MKNKLLRWELSTAGLKEVWRRDDFGGWLTAVSKGAIDKIDTLWSGVEKGWNGERERERDGLRRKQCL